MGTLKGQHQRPSAEEFTRSHEKLEDGPIGGRRSIKELDRCCSPDEPPPQTASLGPSARRQVFSPSMEEPTNTPDRPNRTRKLPITSY